MLYLLSLICYALSAMLYLLCFICYALSDKIYLLCFICYALSAILYLLYFNCYALCSMLYLLCSICYALSAMLYMICFILYIYLLIFKTDRHLQIFLTTCIPLVGHFILYNHAYSTCLEKPLSRFYCSGTKCRKRTKLKFCQI